MKAACIVLFLFPVWSLFGQDKLSLQECYKRAEANYPVVKQLDLISKARSLSVENVYASRLPQVSVGVQGTYQSEVTRIPFEAAGVDPLEKDQYRIYGEISQTLYQGGMVNKRAALDESEHAVEEHEILVELYQLRGRVNELYFGILLSQDQIAQSKLVRSDLSAALRKVESSVANGMAISSAADVLRAEILRIDQRIIEMQSVESTYRRLLSRFINGPVEVDTELERPVFEAVSQGSQRAELLLLDAQLRSIDQSERVLVAGKKPRIEVFIQGGYGRPGYNMLENRFTPYYLGGIRFSWLLSGYYVLARERQIFQNKRQTLESRRETFLFNNGMIIEEQELEVARFEKLLVVDDTIITLRKKVRETAAVQLEQGIITSTDFIQEVNAEDAAKQSRSLHETQLLMAQARLRFTMGEQM